MKSPFYLYVIQTPSLCWCGACTPQSTVQRVAFASGGQYASLRCEYCWHDVGFYIFSWMLKAAGLKMKQVNSTNHGRLLWGWTSNLQTFVAICFIWTALCRPRWTGSSIVSPSVLLLVPLKRSCALTALRNRGLDMGAVASRTFELAGYMVMFDIERNACLLFSADRPPVCGDFYESVCAMCINSTTQLISDQPTLQLFYSSMPALKMKYALSQPFEDNPETPSVVACLFPFAAISARPYPSGISFKAGRRKTQFQGKRIDNTCIILIELRTVEWIVLNHLQHF